MGDPVRMAMVGGGPGAFIGPVHRMAAELDGKVVLVAGAFSRDIERSRSAGGSWGVAADRIHADVHRLIASEAARSDGAEFIAVVTPNATHFGIAKAALEAGLHVLCDKPATALLSEALELAKIVDRSGRLYALSFTYSGYPVVRRARQLVADGVLGRIRKIVVEYSQGWLATAIESEGNKQAAWRTDPELAGPGGCIGDIGVHAFHLCEYVSGERVSRLCADVSALVPGRKLDDDCNVLLRFGNGATGVLHASQIAAGDRNDLILRVWGERGGLEWRHGRAEELTVSLSGQPAQIWHAGEPYAATGTPRLPAGHPQGFIEAFANLYGDFADAIRAGSGLPEHLPGIAQSVRTMVFVERAIDSSKMRSWVEL
jgi:predicted dehydrogenase